MLGPEQKLEIARLLDRLGIDRIEAGFPRVSAEDWEAVKLISAAGLQAEVWGFSRAVPADLEALAELEVRFSVIESPISDLKLEALGVSRETMLERITAAMRFAAEHGIHAAFFGVDSTRAEPDFYRRVYTSAVEAGAARGRGRRHARDRLARGGGGARRVDRRARRAPACRCTSTATTTSGSRPRAPSPPCRAGATYVQGTINGMGERAGNANLGEVALALRALYGVESNLRLERIRAVSERVRELSGYALEPWKPLHRRDALPARERRRGEPVPRPALDRALLLASSSRPQRSIVLGKKSGLDSIRIKAAELGLELARGPARGAARRGQEARDARERRLVSDEEFAELVRRPPA